MTACKICKELKELQKRGHLLTPEEKLGWLVQLAEAVRELEQGRRQERKSAERSQKWGLPGSTDNSAT